MDTSETYIRMCEKAEEIQALADIKPYVSTNLLHNVFAIEKCVNERLAGAKNAQRTGEYGFNAFYQYKFTSNFLSCQNPACNCNGENIWLPRQDQLQEMVDAPYQDDNPEMHPIGQHAQLIQLVRDIGLFSQQTDLKSITSMEQLWLAFVMKEKYGKVWNGTDWVKELMAESVK
jgi:hypothetical protein